MVTNAERAAGSRDCGGDEVFFCSEICPERFDREPARYLSSEGGA